MRQADTISCILETYPALADSDEILSVTKRFSLSFWSEHHHLVYVGAKVKEILGKTPVVDHIWSNELPVLC